MIVKKCRFCGSEDGVTRVAKRFSTCRHCRPALYAVMKNSRTVEQAWPLFHDHAIIPKVRRIKIPWQGDLPEELEATRYSAKDRDENQWYLLVYEYGGQPVEVFTSSARDNDHNLQGRIANLSALTRLISLMLRHVFLGERITLEKIKQQLQRSSRKKRDLPDMLHTVLTEYKTTDAESMESEKEKAKG